MWVNTDGGEEIVSKEVYLDGDYYFDANGWEGLSSFGTKDSPLPLQIRGRGNATWVAFDKKPYRIKLAKKADLMGRGKSKHFVLMAHADDYYGYLRNTVGFELSRRIGLAWEPGQLPIELMLNGEYQGLYFLTEQIKVDENRVNITEQDDDETDPELITGGWLIEMENYPNGEQIEILDENGKTVLFITAHSPEELSTEQYDYMYSFLSMIENSISNTDKNDKEWEQFINIDSLACFYIVNEVMDNIEAFHGSCWMHKDRGLDKQLIFGPVWDFGNSYNRPVEDIDFIYNQKEPRHYNSNWIDRISAFNHFQERVTFHWQRLKDAGGLDIDTFVDDFLTTITPAAALDYERWQGNSDNLRNRAHGFMEMYGAKVAWLDERWSDNSNVDNIFADNSDASTVIVDVLGYIVATVPAGGPMPQLMPGRVYIIRQGSSVGKVILR